MAPMHRRFAWLTATLLGGAFLVAAGIAISYRRCASVQIRPVGEYLTELSIYRGTLEVKLTLHGASPGRFRVVAWPLRGHLSDAVGRVYETPLDKIMASANESHETIRFPGVVAGAEWIGPRTQGTEPAWQWIRVRLALLLTIQFVFVSVAAYLARNSSNFSLVAGFTPKFQQSSGRSHETRGRLN